MIPEYMVNVGIVKKTDDKIIYFYQEIDVNFLYKSIHM